MIKFPFTFLLTIFFFTIKGYSQKKTLHTEFTKEKISIDGHLNEDVWKKAEIATDFIMFSPDNGKPISHNKRTEVKVVYDHDAIYIGAVMYDDEPEKILKEYTLRDQFGTAEHFGVFINGYNDGQQDFRFLVSAAGVQMDGVFTEAKGEDFSWDAIWNSAVKVTNYGWVAEIKIPYAALRFPGTKKQTWGLNFYRELRRYRQQYTWNLIDVNIANESSQAGILEGIENIKTPTRLFLIPYSSLYLKANSIEKTSGELKGGMDIKYGINDAFTLDAILIPDFGQTKFDNVELNLGPFEQQFNENRPFFTEGTDLFNKGGLFYSRRIGGAPSQSPTINENEKIIDSPNNVKLINALKISGRTKGGLGIGVLNAITEKTSALIENTSSDTFRRETIEPISNYNLFVLDQRFNKNSSVSLINTNVTRNGEFRDANVSALVFDLNTKKNTFNISGDYKYSYINEYGFQPNKSGFVSSLYAAETSGKVRFGVGGNYISRDFDNNDLGINFQTHYHTLYGNISYRILNPTKVFNTFQMRLNLYSEYNNNSGRLQANSANLSINTTDKRNDYYGLGIDSRPFKISDYYEPRSLNQSNYLIVPEFISFWTYFSSNYNRKFALDINPTFTIFNEKERYTFSSTISPRYRFSDKISLIYNFRFSKQNNNIGWIAFDENNNTVFARRNVNTYTNTLQGKYSLNNKMNFNLAVRHYWSYAINHDILNLQNDGNLTENITYTTNKNSNFNTWNLDLSYSWWFAPGSQVSVLYRNNSSIFTREFSRDLGANFKNAVDNDNLNHIFSISVRYYIDYNTLKK